MLRYEPRSMPARRSTPGPPTGPAAPRSPRSASRPPTWPMRCAPGINGDQRVATFMWNNAEHCDRSTSPFRAWAPCCTRSTSGCSRSRSSTWSTTPRTEVVVVDNSLAAPFGQLLPHMPGVRHVIVNGAVPEDVRAALAGDDRPGARLPHPAGRRGASTSPGPTWTRTPPRRCVTRPAPRATPRASSTPTGRTTCTRCSCA